MRKVLFFGLLVVLFFGLLVVLFLGCFVLDIGCGLLPYYRDPKSVEIDGEEYVSGFYDRLYLVGIEYREFSSSLFTLGNHHWWHLEDSTFDMYYARHKDSIIWNPTLYCRESQFDEVKSYYQNTDNFDYYFRLYLEDESEIRLSEDIDKSMVEKAITLIVDADNTIPSNPLKEYNRTNFEFDGNMTIRPSIYRRSKDGLFTTTQGEWVYHEEKLYISYDGGIINGSYNALILEDDVNDYMVNLLKEYEIIQ